LTEDVVSSRGFTTVCRTLFNRSERPIGILKGTKIRCNLRRLRGRTVSFGVRAKYVETPSPTLVLLPDLYVFADHVHWLEC